MMSNTMKNSSNLNELEAKIATLERSNFDLKLQLHYLNKKYANATNNPDITGPEVNINVIEDRSADILGLREELDYAKKRILELESEILQIQLVRDKEKTEYQRALQIKPNDSLVTEENRRREREVAMAIAEHDALLIAKLRDDLSHFEEIKQQQEKTMQEMMEEMEKKEKELKKVINEKTELEEELKNANNSLTTTSHRQRQMGNNNNNGNGNGNPMVFSASSDGQQTSIVINSSAFAAGATIGGGSSGNSTNGSVGGMNPTSFLIHQGGVGSGGIPMLPSPATTAASMGSGALTYPAAMRPSSHPSFDALRNENEQLKQRLALMEESVRNQQVVIDNMKASAVNISTIEGEESKRLEAELDKCIEDREKLKERLQKIELEFELACRHIKELSNHLNERDPAYLTGQDFIYSSYRSKALSGVNRVVDTSALTQQNTVKELTAAKQEVQQLTKANELYRQRESELLSALEGVVKRCQELEEQASFPKLRR